jgi:hypothetical protein
MTFKDYIDDEDFLIRIRPIMEKQEWTGQIDVSILSAGDNDLDDDDYGQIMHLCKMVCASVPIMENHAEFGQMAHDFVMRQEEEEDQDQEELALEISQGDGNIVHLNFGSKTKGSA